MEESILKTKVKTIEGKIISLEEYAGKVLLIVNVASKCGFTSHYEQLENIQKTWNSYGFSILGFPCNQFLEQEPGSDQEIKDYCRVKWGITFPMFSKVEVNGKNSHPLYKKLTTALPTAVTPEDSQFYRTMARKSRIPERPGDILWNFEKFLVGRNGQVIQRFSPDMNPERPIVIESIKNELEKKIPREVK